MRLPWFNRSHFERFRSSRRRQRLAASLRIRQLERRRVLDASMQSLLVTPVVASDSAAATVSTEAEPLVFDWTAADEAPATGSQAYQVGSDGELVSPLGVADEAPMNVPPVLVVALDQTVGEGQLLDLRGIGTPPLGLFIDDGGPDSHTVTVNWGDSPADEQLNYFFANGSGSIVGSHTYALEGQYEVRVTVEDSEGASDTKSFLVTVENVPPVLTVALDQMVNEGAVLDLSGEGAPPLGLIADDGTTDTHTATINWGDGTVEIGTVRQGMGSAAIVGMHTYAENGLYEVLVTVEDSDGATDSDSFFVTVKNVPPVLTVALDQMVDEGAVLDLSGMGTPPLGLVADDGKLDTHTATIDWGDGTVETGDVQQGMGSAAIVGTHTYADDGLYEVVVRVMDDDGGASETKSFFVTVKNVPPVLTVALDQMVNEGAVLNLSGVGAPPLGLIADDGKLDTHTGTVDWGDGTVEMAMVQQGMGSAAIVGTHIYLENGIYEVKVRAQDDNGGVSETKSFFVNVKNVPPVLTVALDQMVNEGAVLNLSGVGAPPLGLVADDGKLDTHTATVDWGDGSAAQPAMVLQGMGSAAIVGTHTYIENGVYEVKVRAQDDDGGMSETKSFFVTVKNVPPVLTVALDQMVNEGAVLDLGGVGAPPLGLLADDGKLDTHTAVVDWGDGTVEAATVLQGMGSAAIVGTHIYADNGIYEVKLRATDDDSGVSETKGFFVTVKNVAPAVTNVGNLNVSEGSAFTLPGLNVRITDPGFDNPLNPVVGGELQETFAIRSINWGDGTPTDTSSVSIINRVSGSRGVLTTAQVGHAAHTYADDGTYTITVRVADDDMGAFADPAKFVSGVAGVDFVDLTFTIRVNNENPMFTRIVPTQTTINESEGITFTADFSDPGFDNELNPNGPTELIADPRHESFTYDINWGDGRQNLNAVAVSDMNGSVGVPSTGTFGGSHVYADDGMYTVTLTIRDDNGGFRTEIFVVTVENVNPAFVPNFLGESFEGDDLTSEGITTIRVSFNDPGFDNPSNPNAAAPPSITDTRHESFTHVLNWGDGTIDAVHTYADSGVYTVTVTMMGPGAPQSFTFTGFNSSLQPVLTLVSGQALNDPAVPTQSFTYLVNWGDGAVQTVSLMLKAPGNPLFNNGLTTVLASQRASGGETVLTTGSFQVQHRYTGPPNPANPTASIPITVTVMDDNNGSVSDFILVRNPGIQTPISAIDTTPAVPDLELTPPPPMETFIDQQAVSTQTLQSTETRIVRTDLLVTSERYLQLEVVSPDGITVVSKHRIRDEALYDLRAFFASLPDNHYRIYLVRTENNSRRLIMDVYVRNGRVIDPSDDSEGTRDRPPTAEQTPQAEPVPLDENPLLERLPLEETDTLPVENAEPVPQASDGDRPAEKFASENEELATESEEQVVMILPLKQSQRWVMPLAGLGLAATGIGWSQQVQAAMENADDRDWQRLRRAARLGRPAGKLNGGNTASGGYNRR